jgi:hypothetical protein
MSSLPRSRELGGALGRSVHRVHPLDQRVAGAVQDRPAGLGVVAVEASLVALAVWSVMPALGCLPIWPTRPG